MPEEFDMTGPWEAFAVDPHGFVIDPTDPEDSLAECTSVTIVRRTARPALEGPGAEFRRMPTEQDPADVLWLIDDLDDNPDEIPHVFAVADAVAAALNTAYPS